MYALCSVVVRKYARMYLVYYIASYYSKPECMPMKHTKYVAKNACSCKPKCMSEVCAARALFVQTMMHTAAD